MTTEIQKLENLVELATVLGQQNEYEEILRVVAQKAAGLLNAETAVIMMINPQTRQTVKTIFKEGQEENQRKYHIVQTHISGWMIRHRAALISANAKTDPRFARHVFEGMPVESALGVILQIEGIVIGTLLIFYHLAQPEKSLQQDLAYLEKFAAIAAPFLRNVQKLRQYFVSPLPDAALLAKYKTSGLLGRSKNFIELLQAIEAAARCDVRVLLEGQSGTGKELVARTIHQFSARSEHPFVALDCGAIPASLIESELFGHVRGAFTGAVADRKGLLEEADQGTLFLDEVSNLPGDMQGKLLRVLQEDEIRPIGSNKTRPINVRIIAASSLALRKLVEDQKFREDLFYRLYVYPIYVPALNDRPQDIPFLANYFLKKFAARQQKQAESFHEGILDFMQQRHWPGNIRELENLVERLVTLAPAEMARLDRAILPPDLRKELKKLEKSQPVGEITKSLHESLAEHEEQLIRRALTANHGNQAKTARMLKISEHTLRYKMRKMGIVKAQRA